ncbi:DUF1569 domain-containing protein [Pedobacter steynii]|uniref:DUF1569 domain-containing protein n=1 Tax=Pedobacter steynii TaxID=430522 RepID=A0A1D7QJD3_9SPHI|nr:DUF1569 domain-containing protein [Pedobacter steynii]AOM78782.1 hypothetical protein BFS30_17330 [Pedobacter steynii]
MALPNIFSQQVADDIIQRINQLSPESQAQWGKMNVAQMLSHCCVTYELVYEDKHPKPGPFMKFILKLLIKPKVVSEVPYKRSGPTSPAFIIAGEKDFEAEKNRLIAFIQKTRQLGATEFEGKESHSFGKLNQIEWNNMFYKHLNHHLTQFNV